MEKKLENGACLTAVLRPKSGISVAFSGDRSDIQTAFRCLCMELMSWNILTYSDLNSALKSAFFTSSATSPRK